MSYRNEENNLQERFEMNWLANACLHLVVFAGSALASASCMSYIKQTQAPASWCLVALSAVICIFCAAASALLYFLCRGSEDEEFNEPRRQSLLFAINGGLAAALGLGLVMACL
jgi:hypothetical protein